MSMFEIKENDLINTTKKVYKDWAVRRRKIKGKQIEFCNPLIINFTNVNPKDKILKFCNKHENNIYEFLHRWRKEIEITNYRSIFEDIECNNLWDKPLDEILLLIKLQKG